MTKATSARHAASTRTRLHAGAAMGVIIALGAAQAHAQAQTTPSQGAESDTVDAVVVTGFRSSLGKALNMKRETAAAVDTILAEDIGKFPDLNLSESIQRIPGVAITRDAGEGRQISVRGLGGIFTRVRINGMEALATSGGANAGGGTNRGRSFDFNVFASDLFSQISVQKTAAASTEEGSLGATVDLSTAHPFDKPGFTFAISGKEGYNDLSKTYSPRAAALISNTFLDDKIGILASVAYTERELLDLGSSEALWQTGTAAAPGFRSAADGTTPGLAAVNAAMHPRIPRYDYMHIDQKRLGATGSLQWRPDDKTQVTLDLLYADFKGKRNEAYLETFTFLSGGVCGPTSPASCGLNQVDVVSATVEQVRPGLTALTKGVFNNVDLKSEARYDELDTKFRQWTLKGDHEFTDRFKVSAQVGHSSSDFANDVQSTIQLDQYNVQGYSYDYTQGINPLIGYGQANLTDPSAWTISEIRNDPNWVNNDFTNADLGAQWTMSDNLTLKGGLNYKKYKVEVITYNRSNGTPTNINGVLPPELRNTPVGSYSKLQNYGNIPGPAGNMVNWLLPSIEMGNTALHLQDKTYLPSITTTPGVTFSSPFQSTCLTTGCGIFNTGPEPQLGSNYDVQEKDQSAFAQADFKFTVFGLPVRGDVGVRYVETDQTVGGYGVTSAVANGVTQQTVTRNTANQKYSDTLPSLNLVLEPREDFLIRFGASKVMSRPELGSLRPGVTISTISAKTASSGNPNLEPFRASNLDLALEWYFQPEALLSVAVFHKNLKTIVQQYTSPLSVFSANPFGLPESAGQAACGTSAGCAANLPIWQFSYPINTPGGDLNGIELAYQQPFTFLPGPLKNLGFLGNYTHVQSSITYLNSAGAVAAVGDLTNLSRSSYNATLYYETDRIGARVSVSHRSKYLMVIPGRLGADVEGSYGTTNVDLSARYNINKRLSLSFEGVNLTNQAQKQYVDSSGLANYYHVTGREFFVGFRYTY